MRATELPAGFVTFAVAGSRVVCAGDIADAIRRAMTGATLYEYAERHPYARALAGRGVAYAVPLPGDVERVVIRHNRHGGLFAPLTRDVFLAPTRAPLELHVSEALRARGVATPHVLGYVTYRATAGFQRADVMTREVPNSADLSTALLSDDASIRESALVATASVVRALSQAAARHHDLNVKNILLRGVDAPAPEAMVLDVDRVTFAGSSDDVLEANLARLLRSATKWQTLHGARVTNGELHELAASVRESRPVPLTTSS
ncbi:MAG TPA: lipopolysaccharide kinase InaA family protein [Gemmatimonadaceae bacterium]|nr:lipopolysaccharide kinase InaA family protein [Gemmatimonadaceae bacterium]